MTPTRSIIEGTVLWAPEADLELSTDLLALGLPATDPLAAAPSADPTTPVLEFPLVVPIDLTKTHGIVITPDRLAEMQSAYDPQIEAASLNFDHAWGGPSLGWCERVWLQDGALWVRYVDLAAAAVEGIRSKQYVRRSAEIVLSHPVTGGWYLTGCALLGNARPAIPALPPISLCRPHYVVTLTQPNPETTTTQEPSMADPSTQPVPEPGTAAADLAQLRNQVAEGERALLTILRQRAELQVEQRLTALGSRVTPAMARLARPLLVELFAVKTPPAVELQDDPAKPAAAVAVADRILEILASCPPFEALGAGALAALPSNTAGDPASPATQHLTTHLSAERLTELDRKYQYSQSFGYRQGGNG
jgi:hypothetical protein